MSDVIISFPKQDQRWLKIQGANIGSAIIGLAPSHDDAEDHANALIKSGLIEDGKIYDLNVKKEENILVFRFNEKAWGEVKEKKPNIEELKKINSALINKLRDVFLQSEIGVEKGTFSLTQRGIDYQIQIIPTGMS